MARSFVCPLPPTRRLRVRGPHHSACVSISKPAHLHIPLTDPGMAAAAGWRGGGPPCPAGWLWRGGRRGAPPGGRGRRGGAGPRAGRRRVAQRSLRGQGGRPPGAGCASCATCASSSPIPPATECWHLAEVIIPHPSHDRKGVERASPLATLSCVGMSCARVCVPVLGFSPSFLHLQSCGLWTAAASLR